MGTRPKCKEEKMDWEVHLTRIETTQDRLIQAVDEALMGILGTIVQVVQVKLQLQLQQQVPTQPLHLWETNSEKRLVDL
ncbi:UNVERIFIED_CONTAM: hypothetical protein K2H54_046830 [Gekko kuhli]